MSVALAARIRGLASRLPVSLPQRRLPVERDGWVVVEPRQPGPGRRLEEAWRYRRLVRFFGMRLVEKMTVRSRLGMLWVLIRPLLNVGSRALVFGGLLGAGSGDVPYFLFFLTGMAGWSLFERSLFWAVRSIELNSRLLQKLYVPRMLLPLAAFVPAILDFAIYVVLVVLAIVGYGLADSWYVVGSIDLLLVPAGLLLIVTMTFGIALVLAVLGVHARDVRFALSYVLGFLFFLTPVIYPFSAIPHRFASLGGLNPLAAPLEMVRKGLYGYGEITTISLGVCLGATLASCALGLLFFSRWEATAVDAL